MLLLELSKELRVVVFGLQQGLVEASIIGLGVASCPLQSLELVDVVVEEVGECVAVILELLTFFLESLDVIAEVAIVVVLPLVLAFEVAVVVNDGLDFVGTSVGHALQCSVFSQRLLDLHRYSLDLDAQRINVCPQLDDAVLVDVRFDSA